MGQDWDEWMRTNKPPKRQPDHGADGPGGCPMVVAPVLVVLAAAVALGRVWGRHGRAR